MTLTDEDKKLAEECGFFIGTNISGINLVVIMKDGFSAHIKDTELALLLHKVREAEREKCAVHCKNSDRYRGEYFAEEIRNLK